MSEPIYDKPCPTCGRLWTVKFLFEIEDDDGLEFYWECEHCGTSFWDYAPPDELFQDRTEQLHKMAADALAEHEAGLTRPIKELFSELGYDPEWQAKEREADEDLVQGRYETFDNFEDFIDSLGE